MLLETPFYFALFAGWWMLCFAYCIRFVWQTFAPFPKSQFGFYITDVWALTLALVPALLLLRYLCLDPDPSLSQNRRIELAVSLPVLVLSQLMGIFIARLHSIPERGERMPRRLSQAGWIFAGSVGGLIMLGAVYLLFAVIVLMVWCWPCGLLLLLWAGSFKMLSAAVRQVVRE